MVKRPKVWNLRPKPRSKIRKAIDSICCWLGIHGELHIFRFLDEIEEEKQGHFPAPQIWECDLCKRQGMYKL